jgi:leader peptidase (prepilin peptidase)/N-methyltransferase
VDLWVGLVCAGLAVPVGWGTTRSVPALLLDHSGVEDHDVPGVRIPRWVAIAATSLAWFAAGLRFGASIVLVPYLLWTAVLVLVSVVDLEDHRIPDRVVFPALGASVPLVFLVSLLEDVPRAALWAVVGAAAYAAVLFVFFLVNPAGIGFGDVKLGLLLGLYLGWIDLYLVLVGLAAGALIGALVGAAILVVRGWQQGRRTGFPFGPPLAAGAVLTVVFSSALTGLG